MKPGTRVLIVEDDPYTARLLTLQLEHRNMRTRCEHDGPSGLKAAFEFDPEVIILDVMLPGMDGVGVLKELRRRGNRAPPVARRWTRSTAWTSGRTITSPSRSVWRSLQRGSGPCSGGSRGTRC